MKTEPAPAAEATGAAEATPVNLTPTPLAQWLGISEAEMRTVDLKVALAGAIRSNREAAGLTQAALAKRLGVARPRIAEMESFRPETTLDSLVPAFFASGGTSEQLCALVRRTDRSMSY